MKAALDRISKAQKAHSVSLDLSGLGLQSLPPELFELTHLQTEVFCKKGSEPKELFYVRREGSTVQLEGKELIKYCKNRF